MKARPTNGERQRKKERKKEGDVSDDYFFKGRQAKKNLRMG